MATGAPASITTIVCGLAAATAEISSSWADGRLTRAAPGRRHRRAHPRRPGLGSALQCAQHRRRAAGQIRRGDNPRRRMARIRNRRVPRHSRQPSHAQAPSAGCAETAVSRRRSRRRSLSVALTVYALPRRSWLVRGPAPPPRFQAATGSAGRRLARAGPGRRRNGRPRRGCGR
jgi:hypothetical protein